MLELGVFSTIIAVYAVFLSVLFAIGITLFVLQALGIFENSKKLGFTKPWLAFIPVISAFSLGRVGDLYVKKDGRKSAPLKYWLLILSVLNFLFLILFFVIFAIIISKFYIGVSDKIIANEMLTTEIFKILIPIIVFYFIAAVTSITYQIIYYINLWRIFKIFDNNNAVLFLVLSIVFSFLAPIFIFVIKNKEPKFIGQEKIGFSQNG